MNERKGTSNKRIYIALGLVLLVGISVLAYVMLLPVGKAAAIEPSSTKVFGTTSQTSQFVTEYAMDPSSEPTSIGVDSSGMVWFTAGADFALGELNPLNGTVHEYLLPRPSNANASLYGGGIYVDSSRGNVWFTDDYDNCVWEFSMSARTFRQFTIPLQSSEPLQVRVDNEGNAWFTDYIGNFLGEIRASDSALIEYQVPLAHSNRGLQGGPVGLAIDSSGNIWVAEAAADALSVFSNGAFGTVYNLSSILQLPTGVAVDSDGNVWVTQHGPSLVTCLDPGTNSFETLSTSKVGYGATLPYYIQVDSQGNVWFDEHYGNSIAEFVSSTATMYEYRIPTAMPQLGNISGAVSLALSQTGQPWFIEQYSGKLGTVDVSKSVDLALNVTESGALAPGQGNLTFHVSVTGAAGLSSRLDAEEGNLTTNLEFSMPQSSGVGSYNSTISVSQGSATLPSQETVTISVVTGSVIVSKVVTLSVQEGVT